MQDILKISFTNEDWRTVSIAIARVVDAKPHSCDIKRLVSAYNVLKDDDRSSLAADTLDAHLHVHINMPVLFEFDVRRQSASDFPEPNVVLTRVKMQLISVGLPMYLQRASLHEPTHNKLNIILSSRFVEVISNK